MTDRHAVIWTRISGTPVKMASIVTTARECRITYTKAFVDSGLPGLSLLADPHGIRPVHRSGARHSARCGGGHERLL